MRRREFTKEQFLKLASAYDICAKLNDCDKCPGVGHCQARWDWMADWTIPFTDMPDGPGGEQAPPYDTEYLMSIVRGGKPWLITLTILVSG